MYFFIASVLTGVLTFVFIERMKIDPEWGYESDSGACWCIAISGAFIVSSVWKISIVVAISYLVAKYVGKFIKDRIKLKNCLLK